MGAECDASGLAGAQCDLWLEHLYLLLVRQPSAPRKVPVPDAVTGPPRGARLVAMLDSGDVPRIPASTGALIFDPLGRLLILKPTYKSGWTIPGGQVEAEGETPWEACRREAREESGVEVRAGRLVCVDFLRPRQERPGGMRFLFDCGALDPDEVGRVRVQPEEIADYRFASLPEALALLSGPLRRRVGAAAGAARCVYLEDGRPVEEVTS